MRQPIDAPETADRPDPDRGVSDEADLAATRLRGQEFRELCAAAQSLGAGEYHSVTKISRACGMNPKHASAILFAHPSVFSCATDFGGKIHFALKRERLPTKEELARVKRQAAQLVAQGYRYPLRKENP